MLERTVMVDSDIIQFVDKIRNLNLNNYDKRRMLKLFQVKGINKKNKTMSFREFTLFVKKSKARIVHLKLGPKWNRLVFVDIDKEV